MDKIKSIIDKLNFKQRIFGGIIILIIAISIFTWLIHIYGSETPKSENKNKIKTETTNEIELNLGLKEKQSKKIMVDISGEVITPGVVSINEGGRIIDAITAAGGKTEDADLSKVNLAYILDDGVQVHIPRYNEKNDREIVQTEAGQGIIQEGLTTESKKDLKVNIN